MDCHDARLLLTLQRREPEQLDRIELEAIERHVELCPGCQTWNQSEARFEAALTTAVKNVPLPVGLKGKIAARLAKARPPRRKAWAALAAALLAAVGLGWGAYAWQRPALINWDDLPVLSEERRPEIVQSYFAELGYPMTPPPQFQYVFLRDYKLAAFQGKIVPVLTFQCRQEKGGLVTAHVYCLRDRDFRVGDEMETPATPSPHRQIQIIRGEHELYVVDYAGGALWLLQHMTS